MAGKKVVLDAMIRRADFAQQAESSSVELASNLALNQLASSSLFLKLLRKPDFQRETNHWTPQQIAAFIQSFATGQLIPSLILWKSDAFIFVIDGAHRLSALRAWVEDDYGDKNISFGFFNGEIPEDQKKLGERTRRLVEKSVGRYSDFVNISDEALETNTDKAKIASNIQTRSLHVQWIQGEQEVAESSFFKINSLGTPLDKVEELLLRNRHKSYAIASRSIVRAATGHKYWSLFEDQNKTKIEEISTKLNNLLFQPHIKQPIKTLDLPLGGTSSPLDALKMLLDSMALVDGHQEPEKAIRALENDPDGVATIATLNKFYKVAKRITGNDASSLGLHPAVYFYTERGKHSRFLFLGTIKAIAEKVRNNNKLWFFKFSDVRKELEKILVERKSLINQGLSNVNSRQRVDRVARLLDAMVDDLRSGIELNDQRILNHLGLQGSAGDISVIDAPTGFSVDVKSAVYLKESLEKALTCKVCGGYMDVQKAVSYDHELPIKDGGKGTMENAQLLHPFCNTGIKN